MTDKEKLLELLDSMFNGDCCVDKADAADHLIANGVTVLPCKPGDTMYATHWRRGIGVSECWELLERPVSRTVQYISFQKNGDILLHVKDATVLASYFGKWFFATREEALAAIACQRVEQTKES